MNRMCRLKAVATYLSFFIEMSYEKFKILEIESLNIPFPKSRAQEGPMNNVDFLFIFSVSLCLSHSILNENNNPQFRRWCEIYNVDNDSMFIAVASFRITFIWFLFIFLSPLTCFFFGFFLSSASQKKKNETIWLLCWFYIKITDFSFALDILNVSKLFLLTLSVASAHLVHLAHLILKIEM